MKYTNIDTSAPKKDIQIELIKNMLIDATENQVEYFYNFIKLKLEHENNKEC